MSQIQSEDLDKGGMVDALRGLDIQSKRCAFLVDEALHRPAGPTGTARWARLLHLLSVMSSLFLLFPFSCVTPFGSGDAVVATAPPNTAINGDSELGCVRDFTGSADVATGSSTVASRPELDLLYALNESVGSLSRVELETSRTTTVDLGGRAGRLARKGDFVYVTLRSERSIVVFEETGQDLVEAFLRSL
jgi:hypothetical protein